jgi:succinate dehydrogenase hydrophobic anchor subunit
MRESHWWLLSLAATVLIGVLATTHFMLMHFSPVFEAQSVEQARSLAAVLARGRDVAQMTTYILFLAVALYHGLYGLRGVILELPVARAAGRTVSLAIVITGLAFFAYGAYVTWWTFVQG